MSIKIDDIVNAWDKEELLYKQLGKKVVLILKDLVSEKELYLDISYRIKDLLSIIRKIKKKNLSKEYSYYDLPDKLGVRVICSFIDEMDVLDDIIKNNFKVLKEEKKKDALDHNRLDYISNHYDLVIDASKTKFKKFKKFEGLVFELQVKTLNQHTWSNTSHALAYKQEANLSDTFKRKIFRLLSLYEIADDEFLIVNRALKDNQDNLIYSLLRKTEGKVYRFAKVDFDRQLSLHVFSKLITYLSLEEVSIILREIDSFVAKNEQKIKRIFNENAKRFYLVPFLTQPEIFVIWFILEKFPFSITDNWQSDFDGEDLDQIQNLWGKLI